MSNLFPSASVGRASGSKLANASSPLDAPASSTPTSPTPLAPSSTHPLLASTPSSSSISHQAPSSPEQPSNLPYQARKRTPGGSISSTLSTSPSQPTALSSGSAHDATSPSPNHPPPHPSIVPLFSNPVVPTLSTSQLDSSGLGPSPGESSPTASSSVATIRLKLTSLKAEAQKGVGLSNDSFGMKMLEIMVQKGGEDNWKDTMELVTGKGKMTLLLPRASPSTKGSGSDGGGSGSSATVGRAGSGSAGVGEVTVEMVREHLAICDGGRKDGSIVVTLGGLVGRMEEDSLTFVSFIPTDGPLMASLIDPLTRSQALSSLTLPLPSPIPTTPTSSFGISHPFPSLIPLIYSSSLPFPPPLPPVSPVVTRPRATSSVLPGMTVVPSRNPFAGLFGSRRPATPAPEPVKEAKPRSREPSPTPSLLAPPTITVGDKGAAVPEENEAPSADSTSIDRPSSRGSMRKAVSSSQLSVPGSVQQPAKEDDSKGHESDKPSTKEDTMVCAWGVDKAIKRAEMEKTIGRAMRSLVEKELDGLPSGVILAVKRFISLSHPTASHSRSHPPFPTASSRAKRLSNVYSGVPTLLTIPPPASYSDSEACSSTYQTFFGLVHDELESAWSKGEDADVDAAERDRRERDLEAKVVEGVNRVEGVVTRWGYNLLFSPASSNDSKHDVALASRVAALCMLDLSLDHLGVVTYKKDGSRNEEVVKGLDEVMKSVGDELALLESASHQTPKAKCDVLVRAHKVVIDGLRSLPPIRLRPENEEWTPPPQALSALSPTSSTHSSPLRPKALSLSLEPTPEETTEEKTPRGLGSAEWKDGKGSNEVPSLVLEGDQEMEDTSALKTPMMEAMEDSVMSLSPAEPAGAVEDDKEPSKSSAMEATSSASSITSSVLSNEPGPIADSGGGSSGADLLLPIIIFAVVKSNPSKLVSHLLYIQRYRASMCFSGESSYALVNVTAVVEFLENVDPGSLGLGGSDKVIGVELPPIDIELQKDLSPISSTSTSTSQTAIALQSRLRGRVTQVGELATSGITNVVDTGLGALRSLIGTSQALGGAAAEGLMVQVPGASSVAAATGLMRPVNTRRASNFSIASITASVAGMGSKDRVKDATASANNGGGKEWGAKREMVDVSGSSSRPGSVYDQVDSDAEGSSGTDRAGSDAEGEGAGEPGPWRKEADVRSVRSVSSYRSAIVGSPSSANMIPGERAERMSISERLATVGGGAASPSTAPKSNPFHGPSTTSPSRPSPTISPAPGATSSAATHSRRASLLGGASWQPPSTSSPASATTPPLPPLPPSATSSPAPSISLPSGESGEVAPPNERFLACQDVGELRLGEVGELLREYRRVVGVLKQVGVWD